MSKNNIKQLLVTVGTTKFENLIKNIDKDEFYETIIKHNFKKLIIQKGTGEYIPKQYEKYTNKIDIQICTILNNFENIIKQSDLIISHAGAGILLESLKNKRNVIVCVNDTLMDNHQIELAYSLDKENYVHYCKNLNEIINDVKLILESKKKIKIYPEFNYDAIPNVIYSMLGIN
jgi:beta-1,4-N-acetylglucosaminyltransferase